VANGVKVRKDQGHKNALLMVSTETGKLRFVTILMDLLNRNRRKPEEGSLSSCILPVCLLSGLEAEDDMVLEMQHIVQNRRVVELGVIHLLQV
jgi:hypothetical protein